MKIIFDRDRLNIKVGDLVICSFTSKAYIISKVSNRYTLYDLENSEFIGISYDSIKEAVESYLKTYVCYPKEGLELIINGGCN